MVPRFRLGGHAGSGALALALALGPLHGAATAQVRTAPLDPGVVHDLMLDAEEFTTLLFPVELPGDCVSWRLEMSCTRADLDLYVGRGPLPEVEDVFDEAVYSGLTEDVLEILSVDRLTLPPMTGGEWWVAVNCPYPDESTVLDDAGRPVAEAYRMPFQLSHEYHAARTDGVLTPGQRIAQTVGRSSGFFRTFEVEVPKDASALRIDLLGASHDLDVFARRRRPMRSRSSAMHSVEHSWGQETLVIDEGSVPALRSGAWFIDVFDPWMADFDTEFEILMTYGTEPPAQVLEYPELLAPQAKGPLSAASIGVVEVLAPNGDGGSGTVLNAEGLILTNAHVVMATTGGPLDEVVIALSVDPRRPPIELFRAEVVEFDMARDLALLQARTGFYRQPIPDTWSFPFVEFGSPSAMQIGEPLWIVGYPILGGSRNRVGMNVSRGVLSGFEPIAAGLTFKTDGSIRSGNSGGAALDAEGRLIGVPTSVLGDDYGTVGIVHPVDLIPLGWRQRHGIRVPRGAK